MTRGEAAFRRLLSSCEAADTLMNAGIIADDLYDMAYEIEKPEHPWDTVLMADDEKPIYPDLLRRYIDMYKKGHVYDHLHLTFDDFMNRTSMEIQTIIAACNKYEGEDGVKSERERTEFERAMSRK